MILKVAKVEKNAKIPTRKHSTDAGLDLYAVKDVNIEPHSFAVVETGIKINLQGDYVGLIWPKGGSKHLIGAGVVDESYQGEILVKVFNVSDKIYEIKEGDAIAQFLIQPCYFPIVEEVSGDELFNDNTDRGDSGGIWN